MANDQYTCIKRTFKMAADRSLWFLDIENFNVDGF